MYILKNIYGLKLNISVPPTGLQILEKPTYVSEGKSRVVTCQVFFYDDDNDDEDDDDHDEEDDDHDDHEDDNVDDDHNHDDHEEEVGGGFDADADVVVNAY